jgi:hypothetical protein
VWTRTFTLLALSFGLGLGLARLGSFLWHSESFEEGWFVKVPAVDAMSVQVPVSS